MKTKKDKNYSFLHVNQRLIERFNLSINMGEYNNLNNKLRTNKSTIILKENEDQEIHQINFKEKIVTFIFSVNRDYVTTAMNWENKGSDYDL